MACARDRSRAAVTGPGTARAYGVHGSFSVRTRPPGSMYRVSDGKRAALGAAVIAAVLAGVVWALLVTINAG